MKQLFIDYPFNTTLLVVSTITVVLSVAYALAVV